MSSTVEKIKGKLSIEEVVGSYLTLEKSGTYMKAKCPFHQEKSASFYVSPDRGTFYCFGCGAKGDIFSFVEEMEAVDFLGALKILSERSGVPIEYENKIEKSQKEKIFEIMEEATEFFEQNLKNSVDALLYLKGRGISIESLKKFRVGFAPDEWRLLSETLGKNWKAEELFSAGLIKKGPKGNYDAFRGRIMFPIFDASGRIIAFSGRTIKKDTEEAKYINSPETPVFEKSKTLYGINFAKEAIKEKKHAVLVEGQIDLVMSHQAGVLNTVATSGTSLTYEHLAYLKRITDEIVISFDSDNAGVGASFRAALMALEKGFKVRSSIITSGKDPADIAKENPESWKKSVEDAPNVVDYFISIAKQKNEAESDKIIKTQILPLIRAIESPIDQSRFLSKLSGNFGLPEDSLREEMQKISIEEIAGTPKTESKASKKIKGNLRKAISMLLVLEETDKKAAEEFKNAVTSIVELEEIPDNEKEEIYFEGKIHYGDKDFLKYQKDLLYMLEDEKLREKLSKTMENLKKAEAVRDKDNELLLLKDFQEVSLKLSELRKKYDIIK